jgi:hypothetical protein
MKNTDPFETHVQNIQKSADQLGVTFKVNDINVEVMVAPGVALDTEGIATAYDLHAYVTANLRSELSPPLDYCYQGDYAGLDFDLASHLIEPVKRSAVNAVSWAQGRAVHYRRRFGISFPKSETLACVDYVCWRFGFVGERRHFYGIDFALSMAQEMKEAFSPRAEHDRGEYVNLFEGDEGTALVDVKGEHCSGGG